MKKTTSIVAFAVLLMCVASMIAFAHGGRGHGGKMHHQSRTEWCAVEGCDQTGPHRHDSEWQCGQIGWQGDYEKCPVEDCVQLGLHEHEGTMYTCVDGGAGRGCGRNRT